MQWWKTASWKDEGNLLNGSFFLTTLLEMCRWDCMYGMLGYGWNKTDLYCYCHHIFNSILHFNSITVAEQRPPVCCHTSQHNLRTISISSTPGGQRSDVQTSDLNTDWAWHMWSLSSSLHYWDFLLLWWEISNLRRKCGKVVATFGPGWI